MKIPTPTVRQLTTEYVEITWDDDQLAELLRKACKNAYPELQINASATVEFDTSEHGLRSATLYFSRPLP